MTQGNQTKNHSAVEAMRTALGWASQGKYAGRTPGPVTVAGEDAIEILAEIDRLREAEELWRESLMIDHSKVYPGVEE